MIMKNEYVKPEMVIEKYMAEHNVAEDCSKKPGGRTVYFVCDAGESNKHYAVKNASGTVQTISGYYLNGNNSAWSYGTNYHPCGDTHTFQLNGNQQLSDRKDIITGMHLDDPDTRKDENIAVTIWTNNDTNVHCTTIINPQEWDTSKS